MRPVFLTVIEDTTTYLYYKTPINFESFYNFSNLYLDQVRSLLRKQKSAIKGNKYETSWL